MKLPLHGNSRTNQFLMDVSLGISNYFPDKDLKKHPSKKQCKLLNGWLAFNVQAYISCFSHIQSSQVRVIFPSKIKNFSSAAGQNFQHFQSRRACTRQIGNYHNGSILGVFPSPYSCTKKKRNHGKSTILMVLTRQNDGSLTKCK